MPMEAFSLPQRLRIDAESPNSGNPPMEVGSVKISSRKGTSTPHHLPSVNNKNTKEELPEAHIPSDLDAGLLANIMFPFNRFYLALRRPPLSVILSTLYMRSGIGAPRVPSLIGRPCHGALQRYVSILLALAFAITFLA